jgi:hypothetical protein
LGAFLLVSLGRNESVFTLLVRAWYPQALLLASRYLPPVPGWGIMKEMVTFLHPRLKQAIEDKEIAHD